MKSEKNILIAFLLNLFFALFEIIGGFFTNSVAIITDAIHDMGDALSIGISYFLEKKSKKEPDEKYTYGYARYSVLGALITTVILLVGSILLIINSTKRILYPEVVNYNGMIIFALFGAIVNLVAVYFTRDGKSMNQKSVNLHMLEDVLGWIVVLVGSVVMKLTDISVIDPIMSIGVAIFIFINAFKTFKSIIDLFLEKTPNGVIIEEIKNHLLEIKGIKDVHHVHIWSFDGYNNCATMHVVVNDKAKNIKDKVRKELEEHGISHVTIELEEENEKCDDIKCNEKHININHHHHHHH